MRKSIFEVITEYAVNEGLSDTLQQDNKYMQIQKKLDDLTREFDALELSKEQRLLVDKLISSYNENGAYYGAICYQQGFRDCALLLVEIGMIKGGERWRNRHNEKIYSGSYTDRLQRS